MVLWSYDSRLDKTVIICNKISGIYWFYLYFKFTTGKYGILAKNGQSIGVIIFVICIHYLFIPTFVTVIPLPANRTLTDVATMGVSTCSAILTGIIFFTYISWDLKKKMIRWFRSDLKLVLSYPLKQFFNEKVREITNCRR